ncbi:HAD family phosphatase [Candidatus Woesearchaeota archaeon]|nr:HAD family phosphatase [Candidatus Woesearchaeota archaeon]
MIKAVLVDFGGVLFTRGTEIFYEKHLKKLGVTKEQFRCTFAFGSELGVAYRINDISEKEFWERVLDKIKVDIDPKEYADRWRSCYDIKDETRQFIRELRDKGYLVLGASNNNIERAKYLEKKYSISRDFDRIYYSFDINRIKPNIDYFEYILDDQKLSPQECLFIDDREKNLVPARKLGMKTVLFKDVKKLKKKFEEIRWPA